jgi:hypothetical protein
MWVTDICLSARPFPPRLGHGTTDSRNVPKKIDALVPFFVTSIASTRAHTLALL